MYTFEFRASIKDGVIKIPEAYLPQLKDNVKVIILTEEVTTSLDIIDRLIESPLPAMASDDKPLSREEIYKSRA